MDIQNAVKRNLLITQLENVFDIKEGTLGNLETEHEKYILLYGFIFSMAKLSALNIVKGMRGRSIIAAIQELMDEDAELTSKQRESASEAIDQISSANIYHDIGSAVIALKEVLDNSSVDDKEITIEPIVNLFEEITKKN